MFIRGFDCIDNLGFLCFLLFISQWTRLSLIRFSFNTHLGIGPGVTIGLNGNAPASGAVVGALANHFCKCGTGFTVW